MTKPIEPGCMVRSIPCAVCAPYFVGNKTGVIGTVLERAPEYEDDFGGGYIWRCRAATGSPALDCFNEPSFLMPGETFVDSACNLQRIDPEEEPATEHTESEAHA